MKLSVRPRLWLTRLALTIAAPALALGILEAALRLAGYGHPAGFLIRNGDYFETNPRFGRLVFPRAMARTPCKLRIPVRKAPGAYRVLILGESAAMGTPEPAFGFGRMLEAMLRLQDPGRPVELINAAMTAINSHVVRLIADDCRRLQPDLVVVYMGHNEVVGPFGPGTVFGQFTPRSGLVRLILWTRGTRTGQLLQSLFTYRRQSQPWGGMSMFLDKQVDASDPRLEQVYANFRSNLGDICRAGRAAGASVVVATVASNLRDCPPFASRHGRSFTEPERWQALYQSGLAQEAVGQYAAAAAAYDQAAEVDDAHAELHFRLANCYRQAQATDKADLHYRRARDLDALRFRGDSRINAIIRELASRPEHTGLHFVDAEAALADDDLFYEHVHLQPHGNYLLAKSVLQQVSKLPIPDEPACADLLAWTDYDTCCMEDEILKLTSKPPFTNQQGHPERQARRLAQLRQHVAQVRSEPPQKVRSIYEAALQKSPDDFHLHENYARFLTGIQDYPVAAEHRQWVLKRFPRDDEAIIGFARALLHLGRLDEAMACYRAALASDPDSAESHCGIGEILIGQKRFQEAVAELEEAVRLQPGVTYAMNALGVARLNLKDFDGAARAFQSVLQREPDVTAHLNLASVLYQQGRAAEAIAQLKTALTLADDERVAAQIREGIASYEKSLPR